MRPNSPQKPISSFIPNSTQTPNDYYDLVMILLTGNEWKVLCFAIRHILGFHDRITTRTRAISLSTFEKGYLNYKGTGLNRKTIIEALKELEKYRLLVPVGKPSNKGQEWYLDEYPDLEGLQNRFDANKESAKKVREHLEEHDICDTCPTGEEPKKADDDNRKAVYSVHQKVVQPLHQNQCSEYTDAGVAVTPNNILPSKQIRKSTPLTEKTDDKPTVGNIIQAWLTGIKATSSAKAWSEYNRMIAQDMIDAGITPADITAFLASPHWLNKTPTISKVAEQIGGWKAQQNAQTAQAKATTPSATNSAYDFMRHQLEMERQERERNGGGK